VKNANDLYEMVIVPAAGCMTLFAFTSQRNDSVAMHVPISSRAELSEQVHAV